MTLAMLFLMGYHFWGEILHEWVGAGMFLLFILHHILNGYCYKSLFKRKYNALRILTLCIDLLVLISMMSQMYSGVLMSRYVFDFLPFNGGMSLVRRLHILGAYWGFLLMSLHLGLHWNMILGMFRKATGIKSKAKSRPTYLFLKSEFVFWDYNEPKILFYIDYLALMGLCIFIAHYSTKFIRKFNKKTEGL